MLNKIIHWIVMPCSEATEELEKLKGNCKMTWLQKRRLEAHLAICKWCSMYKNKIDFLDSQLDSIIQEEQSKDFENIDVVKFKSKLKDKFHK